VPLAIYGATPHNPSHLQFYPSWVQMYAVANYSLTAQFTVLPLTFYSLPLMVYSLTPHGLQSDPSRLRFDPSHLQFAPHVLQFCPSQFTVLPLVIYSSTPHTFGPTPHVYNFTPHNVSEAAFRDKTSRNPHGGVPFSTGSCCWELLLGAAAGSCCWELLLSQPAQPASWATLFHKARFADHKPGYLGTLLYPNGTKVHFSVHFWTNLVHF